MNANIGAAIKFMLTVAGMTAKEMAGALGVSSGYLSEVENGKKPPTLRLLETYAQRFDIPVSKVIRLAEYMSIKPPNYDLARETVEYILNNLEERGWGHEA